MTSPSTAVMFFSPYAGIWSHAFPEALVAKAIMQDGADVTYAVCNGMYAEGCYVMSAYGVSAQSAKEERERICQSCRTRRDLLVKKLGVRTVVIDDLMDNSSMEEIQSIVEHITLDKLEIFQYEGFSLGRYASHETIIQYKLTSLEDMTPAALMDFRLKFKHVLMTYFVGKKLLEKLSPKKVVAYNTHISTHYALMNLAESRGIPTFGLHAGGNMSDRLSTLYVFRQDMVVLYKDWIARFINGWSKRPSTKEGIENATRHFMAVTAGRMAWAYSASKSAHHVDVKSYFNIKPKQKVLLATLSSYDELYSMQLMGVLSTYPLIFPTQVDWIRSLIAFVRERDDLFLLIRVHPRELPNKRDSVHSKHAELLAVELQNLPSNVKINWPSDQISLYDLIPKVDVGLNGWSSAGKELAMLGVPVVLYAKDILFYPHSLNTLATNKENYFNCIDQMLEAGWSFERVRQVYRWLAIEYTFGTISIKDKFNRAEGSLTLWQRLLNRVDSLMQRFESMKLGTALAEHHKFSKVILEGGQVVDLQFADSIELDENTETEILRSEIAKILDSVYSNIPIGYSNTIDSLRRVVKDGA